MTVLRIGVDGGCWLNRRGYGRYTRSLLLALADHDEEDRYFIFVDSETARTPDLPERFRKVIVRTREPPAHAASAVGRWSVGDLLRMGGAVARHALDLFFFPSVYTFFPLLRPLRAIVAIRDVIAEHHPQMVLGRRRQALFWRLKLALAIRQADLILTVSDHARCGIIDHFGLAPEQVRVILEAPDPIFRRLVGRGQPCSAGSFAGPDYCRIPTPGCCRWPRFTLCRRDAALLPSADRSRTGEQTRQYRD